MTCRLDAGGFAGSASFGSFAGPALKLQLAAQGVGRAGLLLLSARPSDVRVHPAPFDLTASIRPAEGPNAPPKKLVSWVARPNSFDRVCLGPSEALENTLKLRLGVPPGAKREVSFSYPPRSGFATRKDRNTAGPALAFWSLMF
jgi:hypothetical protein